MKSAILLNTFLVVALLLSSCSIVKSGPPDNLLRADFSDGITNLQIKRKIKCESISPTAEALGVEEAWLVAVEYDSPLASVGHISNFVRLYVLAEDEWQSGYVAYGFDSETCP